MISPSLRTPTPSCFIFSCSFRHSSTRSSVVKPSLMAMAPKCRFSRSSGMCAAAIVAGLAHACYKKGVRRALLLDVTLLAAMIVASRVGLVVHEAGGHALPALATGATRVRMELSLFGGG